MLKGKVALITGGSRGIGRGIVKEYARNNCDVVINFNKNEGEALNIESEVKQLGCRCMIVKADVSNFDEVKGMIDKVKGEFGKIDILVNNAGVINDKTLKNMTKEEWDNVMDVNLNGIFNVTQQSLDLISDGGRIINISSILGLSGGYGQTNYSASKAGVIGFTKSLAKELGSRRITVNAIAPGYIETDMTDGIPEEYKKKILETIPLGRSGKVEDIAECALFLASKGNYITSEVVNVNGGLR
tara:strand:+ start:163 stop:891 length:729 start_codon:yes stop_codon:yes gene_type:complete